MLWPTYCVGLHPRVMGRPLSNRLESAEDSPPAALKAAYQAEQRHLGPFVHDYNTIRPHCGWSGRDGSSVRPRRPRLTGSALPDGTDVGWAGIDSAAEVWRRKCCNSHTSGWPGPGPKPRFLSPDQERELTEEVSSGRSLKTAGEIRDWIEFSEYAGVSYKSGSVYGLCT